MKISRNVQVSRRFIPRVMVIVLLDYFEDVVRGHASAVAVDASFLLRILIEVVRGLQP